MADALPKTAVYWGVEPSKQGPYPDWHQLHARDFSQKDADTLLKSAREWLRSPMLAKSIEGGIKDTQLRAALDLALYDTDNGKYNGGVHPSIYNKLLAELGGQPDPEKSTLLTVRASRKPRDTPERHQLKILLDTVKNPMKGMLGGPDAQEAEDTLRSKFQYTDSEIQRLKQAKTAGFSYAVGTMSVLFVEGRKPVPFNIDVTRAIGQTFIPVIGDDGEEHEANLRVVDSASSGPLTYYQEKAGLKREARVDVQYPVSDSDPEGSEKAAFDALVTIGKKFGFKVERTNRGYRPQTRKTATAGVNNMGIQKQAAEQILTRLDKLAATVQANYETWGMPFETAKGIVNDLDKTADEIEKAAFGEQSMLRRQVEILKQAQVIQKESDEPYMSTYANPQKPIQVEADEPYMREAFSSDDSSGVRNGKSTSGRALT